MPDVALPERQVSLDLAADVHRFTGAKLPRITVGCCNGDEHRLASAKHLAAKLDIRRRDPADR